MIPDIGWPLIKPDNFVVFNYTFTTEMAQWLCDNVKPVLGLWRAWNDEYVGSYGHIVYFWRKEDAMAFKLKYQNNGNDE